MARGAEAYLQTWERAEGIAPDPCRNPDLRKQVSRVEALVSPGMSSRAVMEALGQPYLRPGDRYEVYCARTAGDRNVRISVLLDRGGEVTGLRRG